MLSIESLFALGEPEIEANNLIRLPISQLEHYPNQPFKLYSKVKLKELAEDIKENGLLNPLIVRTIGGRKYQVLSGHNRLDAMKLNGEETVPAIIKECTDNEAKLILVQSNLLQRQELSNREKALAFKMRNDVLKTQGRKKDNELTALEELAKTEKESSRTIARYIKTTQLVPELMDKFDDGEFSLPTAEILSGFPEKFQNNFVEFISSYQFKITTNKAKILKEKITENNTITDEELVEIFNNQSVKKVTSFEKIKNNLTENEILVDENLLNEILQTLKKLKYLKYNDIE